MIDLTNFRRPQRYIGNEWNVIKKSHTDKITICLSYPDLYEIGMSNLGIRIIYGLLNQYPDLVCERVFSPAEDLEEYLRKEKEKLFALESKTSLDKFEVLGFHLGCELNFTNFLNILDLGGIALKTKDRGELIVLGGGIANPEPLAEFVDLFYLGEFEEVAQSFIEVLRNYPGKEDRLKAFAKIEGFYVPKFYENNLEDNQYQFTPKQRQTSSEIKRVYVKDLDKSYYPTKWLTPHTQIIHDRALIEIARGCPNNCTFCQARCLYYPYRQRSPERISELITAIYKSSGYGDFSFLALSASDYSKIEELVDSTYPYFQKYQIGLSLPSLRIDDVVGRLYEKLVSLKKTTLTVAVETARDSLRGKLNKKIEVEKLFETVKIIRSLRIKHLKLYFMFGFAQEKREDLIAIGEFIDRLRRLSGLAINVSLNIFIPKPFSCWENVSMDDRQTLNSKRKIILEHIPKRRNIKISISSIERSMFEAALSRGSRKLSAVIYRAFTKGSKFDGYKEKFSWKIWEESFKEEGIDYNLYLRADTANFPWSFIKSSHSNLSKKHE